jgi:LAO/AO transport system kinase
MINLADLKENVESGSFIALARALTLVENDIGPSYQFLKSLNIKSKVPVIGITGPPGAGKSTLVNAMTTQLSLQHKKVAILAIDPTSPFNYGSLLGDRIRMSKLFNDPNVYIRSVATRGSLGGISAKTLEMVDVMKASRFDLIIVETVGVGQSEVEIAGLADQTILVLVPEAGDEIQHIKSGLMEIAQAFVVNKADREGADLFAGNLKKMTQEQHRDTPIFKTVAEKNVGIDSLLNWILSKERIPNHRKSLLLAEKAYRLIQARKMSMIDRKALVKAIDEAQLSKKFNIYSFIEEWI